LIPGLESPAFSGEQKAELKDAFLSVKRLKRLTEDLTKYAEDVRFGRLNSQIFNLGLLQSQTLFDFQPQFNDKSLEFSAHFIPENATDWQVYGDYYRISQIVNNFIQNAIKFTMPGGRIQLRIRARGKLEKAKKTDRDSAHSGGSLTWLPQQFSDDSSGSDKRKDGLDWQTEYFEFEVEDNGIGIADEDLGKIFEPWHQLKDDRAHNENYGGIGLGLAICQFWVTKMDGKIDVTSRRAASVNDRGFSIFKILIPLRVNRLSRRNSTNSSKLSVKTSDSSGSGIPTSRLVRPPVAAPLQELDAQSLSEAITTAVPTPTLKASQKQMCRILIAEDEPINQRVVHRMLVKDGFRRIAFVYNGFQAIEAVSRAQEAGKQFNLILMDFQMPHVDGPLAATVIRRMPNITQDRLTIIALTAYDDDKSKRDCLTAGMNDFITKPISHAVLRDTLAKHLSLPSVPEGEEKEEDEEDDLATSPLSPASPSECDPII
jgi:CheY-like chemotaxis protein